MPSEKDSKENSVKNTASKRKSTAASTEKQTSAKKSKDEKGSTKSKSEDAENDNGKIVKRIPDSEIHRLKRWNTPTIYNGWEQLTKMDLTNGFDQPFNIDPVTDYMPGMGPMCGYAVTVVCQPSNKKHRDANPNAWSEYRKYVQEAGDWPKVVVVQDLDSPNSVGAFWGEVNSSAHKALGCVGTITDGAVRDVDEMTDGGFKCIARRMCVGHAHSWPVRWGCPVKVFGREIRPGQLVHADKHGFLAVPEGEEVGLLEASEFMDMNECETVIPATRGAKSGAEACARLDKAGAQFGENVKAKFGRQGEH